MHITQATLHGEGKNENYYQMHCVCFLLLFFFIETELFRNTSPSKY